MFHAVDRDCSIMDIAFARTNSVHVQRENQHLARKVSHDYAMDREPISSLRATAWAILTSP